MKNKSICIVVFLYFLILPISSSCQNITIQGKIIDGITNSGIPFCSASLLNTGIGCYSNSEGEFIFHCPDSLVQGKLVITCIGYKTEILLIDSLRNCTLNYIKLVAETYQLDQVDISPQLSSASDIVRQALRKIHKNYQRSPYYMEAFLRDKVFNLYDSKNVRLTEAAIGIEKREFTEGDNADKVKILAIRNSYNFSKLGSSIQEKLAHFFWGYSKTNPIYKILQDQDFTDREVLRKLLKNELYSISLSGHTMFDGKSVSIIDIKEEYVQSFLGKIKTSNAYHLIRLFIEEKNYAIIRSETYIILKMNGLKKVEKPALRFKQDSIASMSVKQYEQINQQYYLKYASFLGRIHDQPDISQQNNTLYLNATELLINKIVISRKEFDRIRHRNALKKDIPLWNRQYVYDPSFWRNYNILIDKPLNSNVLKDLGREVPLDNQFYDAGEKNSKK
ncbi:MAG: carboxypeptidase-like regulatory domain-containing protein [Paludibacter sp.]